MKTTLEELLDYLHLNEMHEEMNENLQVHNIVYKVAELLRKEKEQIIRAFDVADNINTGSYINGEDYFNQTYIPNS